MLKTAEQRQRERVEKWAAERLDKLKRLLPIEGKWVLRLEGSEDDVIIHFNDGSSANFCASQSCLSVEYDAGAEGGTK